MAFMHELNLMDVDIALHD